MATYDRGDYLTFDFVFDLCSFFLIVSLGFIRSHEYWNDCFRFLDGRQRSRLQSNKRNSLTHSSSSLLEWNIRPARNNNFHPSRSLATCSTAAFQLVHPRSLLSLSMVLLHVVFGLPRPLLLSGVQLSVTLQLLSVCFLNT